MQSISILEDKKREALKQYTKEKAKQSTGFVKFCYVLTILLRILAIVLGIANIVYVAVTQIYVYLCFLIMTFFIPFVMSYMPAAVYLVKLSNEYRFRTREAITFTDKGFLYSYGDNRAGFQNQTFAVHIDYDKVKKLDFEPKTKELTISGDFPIDIYEESVLKEVDKVGATSFFDTFEIDIYNLLLENCHLEGK